MKESEAAAAQTGRRKVKTLTQKHSDFSGAVGRGSRRLFRDPALSVFPMATYVRRSISAADQMCHPRYMLVPATYVRLAPEDRLAVLRMADQQRKWSSLDNRRLCLHCHRLMTGRQIEITCSRHGQYVLHCPTTNCPPLRQASGFTRHAYPPREMPRANLTRPE